MTWDLKRHRPTFKENSFCKCLLNSLEKEMATHYSILAWKIPWTEEPLGYRPWGRKESDTTELLHLLSPTV